MWCGGMLSPYERRFCISPMYPSLLGTPMTIKPPVRTAATRLLRKRAGVGYVLQNLKGCHRIESVRLLRYVLLERPQLERSRQSARAAAAALGLNSKPSSRQAGWRSRKRDRKTPEPHPTSKTHGQLSSHSAARGAPSGLDRSTTLAARAHRKRIDLRQRGRPVELVTGLVASVKADVLQTVNKTIDVNAQLVTVKPLEPCSWKLGQLGHAGNPVSGLSTWGPELVSVLISNSGSAGCRGAGRSCARRAPPLVRSGSHRLHPDPEPCGQSAHGLASIPVRG